jgi:hypothetical protein
MRDHEKNFCDLSQSTIPSSGRRADSLCIAAEIRDVRTIVCPRGATHRLRYLVDGRAEVYLSFYA